MGYPSLKEFLEHPDGTFTYIRNGKPVLKWFAEGKLRGKQTKLMFTPNKLGLDQMIQLQMTDVTYMADLGDNIRMKFTLTSDTKANKAQDIGKT